jgi:flagellar hook-length control protein FliK
MQIPGQSSTPERTVQAPVDAEANSPFNDVLNGLESKPEPHTEQNPPEPAAPNKAIDPESEQSEEMVANAGQPAMETAQQVTRQQGQLSHPAQAAAGGGPATVDMAAAQVKGGKILPMGGKNAPVEARFTREPGLPVDGATVASARAATLANQGTMELAALPEIDAGNRVGLTAPDSKPGLVLPGGGTTASETAAATSKADSAPRGTESQATMRAAAGDAGWGEELRNRINWFNKNGIQKAELRLHPAELGSLEIRITTDNDNASIVFYSQNRAARELMEAEMPRLREMFAQTGIELNQSDVSEQSLAQYEAGGQDGPATGAATESDAPEDSPTEAISSLNTAEPGAASGLIDYYI